MPRDISVNFAHLPERNFLTPTFLSRLVMLLVLPAKKIFAKDMPLPVADDASFYESWEARSKNFCKMPDEYDNTLPTYTKSIFPELPNQYAAITDSHDIQTLAVEGIEGLQFLAKQKTERYEIFCCGNGMDGLELTLINARIQKNSQKNYIFWNYPGVGSSLADSDSVYDLFEHTYQLVKKIITDQGVSAQHITLYGCSLGGGIAAYAARRLHAEGHYVHLTVDRSFSRISAVLPEHISANLSDAYPYAVPLLTAMITWGLWGTALGLMLAGSIATLGLVIARGVLAIGCSTVLASYAALGIDTFFNSLATVLGVVLGLFAILSGSILGAIIGVFLSIQYLWTEEPWCFPMLAAFHAAAWAACCEIDSVTQVYDLVRMDSQLLENNRPLISVINSLGDGIIGTDASLNKGLGFFPQVDEAYKIVGILPEPNTTEPNIDVTWYSFADHDEPLQPNLLHLSKRMTLL